MKSSVIICTKDREKDLINCINSINKQTFLPNELIIVDDGNLNKSKIKIIINKKIKLKYIKTNRAGTSVARNIGVKNASGDIIFFFDDDVILYKNYIKYILEEYKKDKFNLIKGIGGISVKEKYRRNYQNFLDFLNRLFFVLPKKSGVVLPSGFWRAVCKEDLTTKSPNLIKVEAFSGCSMSFRKEIFKKFLFDKNLTGYALGEDLDISYRIFKEYLRGLYIRSNAKLIHKKSKKSRLHIKDTNFKLIINKFYFFKKNIDKTFKNYLIYLWSLFGLIFIDLIFLIRPKKVKIKKLIGKLQGLFVLFKVIFLKQNINKYL